MPIEIRKDLIREHSYDEDDRGATLLRVYVVTGLNSSSRITTDALYASDANGQIPKAGQQHDTLPDLQCRRVQVVPFAGSRSACYVKVWYAKIRRRLLDVRLNGVTINTATSYDRDGKLIVVGYKEPTNNKSEPAKNQFPDPKPKNGYDYDYGEVPFVLNETAYEVVYLEDESPWEKIKTFKRRINSRPWNGGEQGEWFCEDILGQIDSPIPRNMGQLGNPPIVKGKNALFNWVVTYRFRHRPAGKGNDWNPLVLFTDLNTGRKPSDIDPKGGGYPDNTKGNGWTVANLYEETDFGDLDIVEAIK